MQRWMEEYFQKIALTESQGKMSLNRLSMKIAGFSGDISFVLSIANHIGRQSHSGTEILSALFSQLEKSGHAQHQDTLSSLLESALMPFSGNLYDWMTRGHVDDPIARSDFFVEEDRSVTAKDDQAWDRKFILHGSLQIIDEQTLRKVKNLCEHHAHCASYLHTF